jgi:hypothetical protein
MLDQLIVEGDTRYHSRELLQNAIIIAGKSPQLILTCIHDIVGLEEVLRDTELIPVKPKKPEIYVEQVNSFLSMLKERDTILRSFKSLDTIRHYLDGWMVNYNYFQIQDILKDKTPAEAAGIFYQIKSWENLINERKYLAKRP